MSVEPWPAPSAAPPDLAFPDPAREPTIRTVVVAALVAALQGAAGPALALLCPTVVSAAMS